MRFGKRDPAVAGSDGRGERLSMPRPATRLRRDLAVVLAIKIAALIALRIAFFSEPLKPHLNDAKVAASLLNTRPAPEGARRD